MKHETHMNKTILYIATIQECDNTQEAYQIKEKDIFPCGYKKEDKETHFENEVSAIKSLKEEFLDNDITLEETDELDGKINNQNGAKIYKLIYGLSKAETYYIALLFEEINI